MYPAKLEAGRSCAARATLMPGWFLETRALRTIVARR